MAKKLFTTHPNLSTEQRTTNPDTTIPIDDEELDAIPSDFVTLENYVEGFCSVGRVIDSISTEALLFVDPKNRVLYNEYVANITAKMGVPLPRGMYVSAEGFVDRSVVAINSEIALEGWMGDIWKKIKGFFVRLYEKIKAVFKRYFTKLGRAKGGLENVLETLKETKKDLKTAIIDNYTGSVLDKFKGGKNLNSAYVKLVTDGVSDLNAQMVTINKAAADLASKHLVPPGFIADIKNMKELAKSADTSKAEVDEKTPGALKALVPLPGRGQASKDRKGMKSTSANLAQTARDATNQAGKEESKVTDASLYEAGSEEGNKEEANKEFAAFSTTVHEKLKKFVNVKLIGGKTFTKVEIKDGLELEIDMATDDEKPENITLSDKTQLTKVVQDCLDMIKSMEKDLAEYGKVNDTIITKLNTVDSLVTEIDRNDPEKYGKYKKLINEQVRTRLTLMQKFFSNYNKIGKSVFEIGIETCEGVTAYSVLSLKYFG